MRGALIPIVKDAKYRPSTGKFKEAIFSILSASNLLENSTVLDMFAGTGSLGFEALSRGAKYVTFVDIDPTHLNTAKTFAEKHKVNTKTRFIKADSTNLMPTDLKYDLVFLDPPYGKNMVEKAIAALHKAQWLAEGATLVIEVGAREDVVLPDWCEIVDKRVYGGSKMLLVFASSSRDSALSL